MMNNNNNNMGGDEQARVHDPNRPLRSGPSLRPSFVRFFNTTSRQTDVIWINYEGLHVKYKSLRPREFFDINTFVNHPWIFRDSETHDRLVVKCKDVFYPEPWDAGLPQQGPRSPQRRLVCITIPVYTLKERCFQVFRCHLKKPDDVYSLDVPQTLQREFITYVKDPT